MKNLKVEGIVELKLNDKNVKNNLEKLKNIKSTVEIDSNINDIINKIDNLKNVKSDIEFNSNINDIIKEITNIEKENVNIDFDYNLSNVKKELEQLKNSKINIKSNADQIKQQIDKIKNELSEKQTIRAKVEINREEWDQLKREWSEKYHIDAVADMTSVGAAYLGFSDSEKFNELMTIMRERGLSKEEAQKLIEVGLKSGYSLDEIKDGLGNGNEALLKLAASNEEYAAQLQAALAMAERGGTEAGADDIRRMVTALLAMGKSYKEVMKLVNAEVIEMKQGHTEVAEAIREFSVDMSDTLDPEKFASILIQAQASGAQDVGQLADAIYSLSLSSRQMGFNVEQALKDIKNTKDDKSLSDLAKKYNLSYEQIAKIHDYLQRVDLNKDLPDNTDELDRLIDVNKDQKGILANIYNQLQSYAAGSGALQYGTELGIAVGGLKDILSIAIGSAIGNAITKALPNIKNLKLPNLEFPNLSNVFKNLKLPDLKLPNLTNAISQFSKLGSAVKLVGRSFAILSAVIEPVSQLLQGDLQGAMEHLKLGLIELAAWPVALGEAMAGAALYVGSFFGLFDLNGDSPLAAARAGMLTLLAAFESIYAFITGDWGTVQNTLQEAFETLGVNAENAKSLAGEVVESWKQIPTQIVDSLSSLGASLTKSFTNALNDVKQLWDDKAQEAYNWGIHFLDNLINGIKSKISEYTRLIQDLANKAKEYLGHTTPEKGPLKDDDKWGIHFMENWITGIKSKLPELNSTVHHTATIISSVNGNRVNSTQIATSKNNATYNISINVVGKGYDEQQLARHITYILKKQTFR